MWIYRWQLYDFGEGSIGNSKWTTEVGVNMYGGFLCVSVLALKWTCLDCAWPFAQWHLGLAPKSMPQNCIKQIWKINEWIGKLMISWKCSREETWLESSEIAMNALRCFVFRFIKTELMTDNTAERSQSTTWTENSEATDQQSECRSSLWKTNL